MKNVSELKFDELTLDQKLGMVHAAMINSNCEEAELDFVFDRIKAHALGAVWVQFTDKNAEKLIKTVREIADYPILIFTDAENGMFEYTIGRHNPISGTGDEKYAYAFGKAIGNTAKKMGYNVVCCPILDVQTNGTPRSFGSDKYTVAKMAAAEAKGLHDSGILTVGKHYPSSINPLDIDSHMAESFSDQDEKELLDQSLFAYLELMKEDLLDGIMVGHEGVSKIDPKYPASLSKKIIDIIKNKGFSGFSISDALGMMGILAKFGAVQSKGLSVEAGVDLALTFDTKPRNNQNAINECYEKGIISPERLDEAVKSVLKAQHKVMLMNQKTCDALTEEESTLAKSINVDAIYSEFDEGLSSSISRDGKHLFAVMVHNETTIAGAQVDVDTFSNGWYFPNKIAEKLMKLFPNSKVDFFHQHPAQMQNWHIFHDTVDYEDVIFITFTEPLPYIGKEHITIRTVTLIEALQYTNRVSAIVHFGNPRVLEALPHIPRYILGGISSASVDGCLDVLAGNMEAKGVKTYDFKLK